MIKLKSPYEVEAIRAAGRILKQTHDRVREACVAGVTTAHLDQLAEEFIRSQGGAPSFKGYRGFPGTLCVSVNEEVVHGIPGPRVVREGDLVSVDCGVTLDGFIADAASTIAVGVVSPDLQRLLDVTREALHLGIEAAMVGGHVRDVSSAVQAHVERHGFSVVRELVGHGVGFEMHEEPQVPNYVEGNRKGARLEPGLVIAIEPMVNLGRSEVRLLDDGWTIVTRDRRPSAHFEHTIAVTSSGPLILTDGS